MTWSSGDLFETFVTSLLVEKEINHYLSKQAVRLGLSLQEFQVLWIVANSEELVLTELAMITTQSKDELQGVVASLEADGLIFGTCNGISRKRVYRATQEGRTLIEQTPVYGGANYSCHEFDPEIIWTYVGASRRLIAAFRGHDPSEGAECRKSADNTSVRL